MPCRPGPARAGRARRQPVAARVERHDGHLHAGRARDAARARRAQVRACSPAMPPIPQPSSLPSPFLLLGAVTPKRTHRARCAASRRTHRTCAVARRPRGRYVKGEHVVCLTPQAVDDWLRMHGKRQLTIDAALLRCAPTPPLPPPPPTADGGAAPFCTMAACAAAAAPAAAHSPAERSAGAGVVAAPAATARGAPAAGQGGSTGRVKGNPASHGMPTARARALSARASGVSALGLVARTGSRAPAARCAPLARTGKA